MNRFVTICALTGVLFSSAVHGGQPRLVQPSFDQELPMEESQLPSQSDPLLDGDLTKGPSDCFEPPCETEQPCCGCEATCGCENGCCSGYCDSGWSSCLGDCSLGDAWTLKGYLQPCCDKSITYGGWREPPGQRRVSGCRREYQVGR